MSRTAAGRGELRARAWAAGLAAATFALYLPSLRAGFVDYDDPVNVVGNPWLGRWDAAGLARHFTATLGGHFQPLAWLSLSLDRTLWGLDPCGYHLTSALLFAVSAAAFFLLLRGLLGGERGADLPAAAAAALWAWHPLRVESVAWVTERRDLLCVLFLLLGAGAYRRAVARDPRSPRLDAALLAFAAAALSKVVAGVFPVLLLLLDVSVLRRPVGLRRLLAEKASFFLVAAAAALLTVRAQFLSGAAAPAWVSGSADRLLVFAWTPGWTLWKTLWPAGLAPYLSPDFAARSGLLAPLSALTAAAWLLPFVAWARGHRGPAALGAAFLVTLLPASGLFRTGTQLCADRFTVLPAAVLSIGAAFALKRAGRRAAAVLPVALALAALTFRRIPVWHDAVAFWERAEAVDPGPVAATGLISALQDAGRVDEAEARKAALRAAHPDSAAAHGYAGEAAGRAGDWAAAEREMARAEEADPAALAYRIGRGVALLRLDRVSEALSEFDAAVDRAPEDASAWYLRAAALARLGRLGEAEESVGRSLDLDGSRPDARTLRERLLRARGAPPPK